MSECIKAVPRTEKPNKVRKNGFIPGVVYGKSLDESIPVMFDEKELLKLLQNNVFNTTLNVWTSKGIRICLIKEIQKDPITDKVLHVSLHVMASDQVVKVKVPIVFQGKENLYKKQLILEVQQPEIMIAAKPEVLPEFLEIDVSERQFDDKITFSDVLPVDGVELLPENEELIAVISMSKNKQNQTEEEEEKEEQ